MSMSTFRQRARHLAFGVAIIASGCSSECTSPLDPEPQDAFRLLYVTGSGQTANAGATLTLEAKAVDANGDPVKDVGVDWSPMGNGVIDLASGYSLTQADGISRAVWTLPALVGHYNASASLNSKPSETVAFQVVVDACIRPFVIEDNFQSVKTWLVLDSLTPGYTHAEARRTSGGNAAEYREMEHVILNAGEMNVYHLLDQAYDPSASNNAIHHINYSEDRLVVPPAPYPGAQVGAGLFFVQVSGFTGFGPTTPRYSRGGPAPVFTSTTWSSAAASGLTAADFTPSAGAPAAMLGAGGAPIRFGYLRRNSSPGAGTTTVSHGIDNFTVTICRF